MVVREKIVRLVFRVFACRVNTERLSRPVMYGEEVVTLAVNVPLNFPTLVSVISEVLTRPREEVRDAGFGLISKSPPLGTILEKLAVCTATWTAEEPRITHVPSLTLVFVQPSTKAMGDLFPVPVTV